MSKMGVRPEKLAPKDAESINHKLLCQAGFIHQEMAGVYTFLPLGVKVLNKIENIIRKHMDKIGSEILMSSLAPVEIWKRTKRFETVDVLFKAVAANNESKLRSDTEYVLSPTHEEMVTPIAQKYNASYKDLPAAFYQIQTKFRNEPRAKSGLLRGREFRMKDLYSFHTSEEDLKKYYEESKQVYKDIFIELGLGDDTMITLASGGDFTKDYSHEFQTRCESGEDTIYLNKKTGIAYNKEVMPDDAENNPDYEVFTACEVGNIFPLGTKFSVANDYKFTDKDGEQKLVWMGSYGIGPSRLVGVIVEKFHDERGIVWPKNVAPFAVHLVDLQQTEKAKDVYEQLTKAGIEVLLDDRESTAGEKFAGADLIGCPIRLVVSQKTLDQNGVEWKLRNSKEIEIVSLEKLVEKVCTYMAS